MSAKDSGPAFPRALPKGEFTPEDVLRIIEQHAGMTLRDYFAAKVLPWCLALLPDVRAGETKTAAHGRPRSAAAMLTYRVSSVEAFRRWEADEDGDTDRLIADIRGGSPASPVMKAGTAFHKCLEDAIAGTDYESMSAQGHHFVFAGDFSIDLPQVRELRASHVYMVDGEPIRISGQVDTIDGRLVSDHKTTSRFDPERYLEGAQWKLYLDIFEADRFRWNVFEIKEVDGGAAPPDVCTIDGVVVAEDVFAPGAICYEVQRQHTLEQYRYPGMEDDCQHLVERFARFVREYIEAPALGVAA